MLIAIQRLKPEFGVEGVGANVLGFDLQIQLLCPLLVCPFGEVIQQGRGCPAPAHGGLGGDIKQACLLCLRVHHAQPQSNDSVFLAQTGKSARCWYVLKKAAVSRILGAFRVGKAGFVFDPRWVSRLFVTTLQTVWLWCGLTQWAYQRLAHWSWYQPDSLEP